jgi:hypothetical protein
MTTASRVQPQRLDGERRRTHRVRGHRQPPAEGEATADDRGQRHRRRQPRPSDGVVVSRSLIIAATATLAKAASTACPATAAS